ncbi:MAG: NAD-dependent epimerase/dehydratase family protein [Solirubrobacterales bacterium]
MRFLVTGATGKVGHAVASRLVERGDEVVALVRDIAKAREALPPGVELAGGDVTDPDSIRSAAAGADGVFNCMGLFEQWFPDPGIFDRVNAEGARNVIVAAREAGVTRAVHTSTFDVFHAETEGTVSEAAVADYPKGTAYERSKQHAEELVLAEAEKGIEVVIVNPSAVYGPGPWQGTGLDKAIRDAIHRRLPGVPPGGMTFVHVDDVAAGQLAAFERGEPGQRYILADGYTTMREMLSVAVGEAGRGWVPPTMPVALARGLATAGEGISRLIRRPPLLGTGQLTFLLWQARADSARAQTELGIRFTPWQEGIRRTVRWMLETGRA